MNKIYDIDSDQLKCSFCMAYFKCSLHFANLQRYAVKACTSCLASFSYSILHPQSFRLYRLLLLDVGVDLPPNSTTTPTLLQQAMDELNYKVSLHFEQSIEGIMREMETVRHNLQLTLDKLKQDYSEILEKNIDQDGSDRANELQGVIAQLRKYEVKHILSEKGRLLGDKKGDMLKSVSKSPFGRLQKENMQSSNYSNATKMLKSKICGTSSSRLLASSTSNSKLLSQSRQRAFSKSHVSRSILKSMEASVQTGSRFGQQDRSEIGRLLEQRPIFESYMPCEVVKQSNVCMKSQGSRNVIQSVLELRSRTAKTGEVIELIGGDASRTNFACYLRSLKEMGEQALATVKTVRMIRCQLVDADMDHLLHLVSQMPMVETLIATNNKLTELSVEAATAFKERHPSSKLTNLYLGNNHISGRTLRKEQGSLCIHL